jgi:hypothetical protein
MAIIYDSVDLEYSWNGDFQPGQDGDLADTSDDQIRSLEQEIQTIANSALGDWEEHPTFASSLDDFVGEPNNRDTAAALANRLRTALISNNIVAAGDLSIRIIPIGVSKVMITIAVVAASTPNNSIIEGQAAVVALLYDYVEHGISFIDKPLQE